MLWEPPPTSGLQGTGAASPNARRMTTEVFARLIEQRIIYLTGAITDATANLTIAQLVHLDQEDPERPIELHINSEGGAALRRLRFTTPCR